MTLTQKEDKLLQDQKKHEEICIQKYTNYANRTKDPQLRQLFNTYASQENQHLNTINQILSGSVPQMGQAQGQQQGQQQMSQNNQSGMQTQMQSKAQAGLTDQDDASLCTDVLMTEKYISGTYDTAIFEFADSNIRQVLNHIQKEEQQHGEGIYNYMVSHGMYDLQ